VAAGDRNDALGIDLVRPNPFESVSLVWSKVWERGWRRIGGYFPHDPQGPSQFDIKRVAAFEYWQNRQLPTAERIPVCEGLVNDVTTYRQWFQEHRPEAIISTVTAPYHLPEYHEGFDPPAFTAVKGGTGEVAGCGVEAERVQIAAIDWLDQKLRHGYFGLATDQQAHVVTPRWNEGKTLPYRES
jgi:hypothetical protein